MALADNKRLYDIATRQQVYVENVKVWHSRQFDLFLRELSEELRKLIGRIKFTSLDSLTKKELNSFLVELRRTQSRLYSVYLTKLTKQLEDFMRADNSVTKRVFASAFVEEEVDDEEADAVLLGADDESNFPFIFGLAAAQGGAAMWSKVNNTLIPANGLHLGTFLTSFAESAQSAVRNQVTKSYANAETVAQLTATLLESSPQGTGSVLAKISRQGAAAIDTSLQHISQMVSAAITSGLFGQYVWYSVIDSATTDVCIDRNRRIYTYGEGPVPPAHILCRSHIAPVTGNNLPPRETFGQWFKRQPQAFRSDVGESNPYRASPLTTAQYAGKVDLILSS